MMFLLFSYLLLFESFVLAQDGPTTWTAAPFNPPSFPLAVKTPYVNAWDPQGNEPAPVSNSWARGGSTAFSVMGWFSMISVDDKVYQIMGGQNFPGVDVANQVAISMTPTRTSVLFEAGPVTVNATYLSPVEPNDLVRQSLPFSYYYLSITSNTTHSIKVYNDISAEWIGGDNNLQSNWSATDDGSVVYLQTQLTAPAPFQELNDRPMDGIAYHAMLHSSGISWQIEGSNTLRQTFGNGTALNNSADSSFHPVGVPFDTFAIALDLGTIQNTTEPIVWAVGVVRDPAIQFTNSNGQLEERRAYYWSAYSTIHDAILGVLNDFGDVLSNAIALDNQILHDGSQVSTNYYDLLALTTRQAMGAIDITVGQDSAGTLNTSDVKAFMRGAGGIGSGGVNCVDVIYAASPIYLYLNSTLLGYLLKPLLEYQGSSLYPNPYAAIDIGTNYSMATGNNKQHDEGIEQSGNMLIMTYAHAQRTGDTSLLSQHYTLLRGWADYLVDNSLVPESQRPSLSDGISAVNQTNLALKGIIGIGAMAKISSAVGQSNDADHYQTVAASYIQQWRTLAFSSDQSHVMTQYGQVNSYTLLYNLYAHKLLQLNLLPDSDFVTQTAFYKSKLVSNQFGLPLDSSAPTTSRSGMSFASVNLSVANSAVLDWMMFTAAIATDNTLRDGLIAQIHGYASPNKQNQPFEVVYNPITADQISGSSSPAQGAMFALLANNVPIKLNPSGGSTSNGGNGHGHSTKAGAIAGGVVAGVVAFVAIVAGVFFFLRRRRVNSRDSFGNQTERIQAVKRVKPSGFSSEAILEPLGPMTQFPSGESQPTLLPQSTQHLSSVSLLHKSGQSTPFPSSSGSPPALGVSPYLIDPSTDNAVLEKQRLMLRAYEERGTSSSALYAPVPSRAIAPLAEGSSPTHRAPATEQNAGPDLRSELDDLRREVERMRQDREAAQEAPPLYDSVLEEGLRR